MFWIMFLIYTSKTYFNLMPHQPKSCKINFMLYLAFQFSLKGIFVYYKPLPSGNASSFFPSVSSGLAQQCKIVIFIQI